MKVPLLLALSWYVLTACNEEMFTSHTCDSILKVEPIRPAIASLQWIPYREGSQINFKGPDEVWQFKLEQPGQWHRNAKDSFLVYCRTDSQRLQIVQYSTSKIVNRLSNSAAHSGIQYFLVNAQSYLDEHHSTHDDIRWLTLLEVHVGLLRDNGMIEENQVLQTLIQNNGFLGPIPQAKTLPAITIGNRTYKNVMTGNLNDDDFKLYYNTSHGIVGFVFRGQKYYLL